MTVAEAEVRRPQPKQARFLSSTEDEVLYGGAAFGGKTEALLMHEIRRREKYPGSAGLMLRRTFQDLNKEGALIPRSKEILWGRAHWSEQYHKWTYPNGSVTQFGYLQNPDDHLHYQGTIWEDIKWEELTQFPNEQRYEYVNTFCRSRFAECKPLVRATTNPGGPGHGWVKSRFIDIAPWGETYTYKAGGGVKTRLFIPARAEDNAIGLERDPEYVNRLQALPEALRLALWEGSWDSFEGQVFANWRRDLHVCEPFKIPANWTRWTGIDYGFAAPFCCLWFARPPDKSRLVIYRELYATGWRAREQALRIKDASKGEKVWTYAADPSMWQQRRETVGNSIADEYAEAGVILKKANNDRMAGLEVVRQALDWKALPGGRVLKPPLLQAFSTCFNFIRTIPALPYDPIKVEDVDTDAEDHAYDAFRYGVMAAAVQEWKRPEQEQVYGEL